MPLLKKSYLVHIGLWILLCFISLFINIGTPLFFGFIYIVSTLVWSPLGFLLGMENPHSAMFDTSEISVSSIIIWFSFLTVIVLLFVFKAINKWKNGTKNPMKLFAHFLVFVIGVFLLAAAGSINFPFRL